MRIPISAPLRHDGENTVGPDSSHDREAANEGAGQERGVNRPGEDLLHPQSMMGSERLSPPPPAECPSRARSGMSVRSTTFRFGPRTERLSDLFRMKVKLGSRLLVDASLLDVLHHAHHGEPGQLAEAA
jgi:hypothetical protein